MLALKGQEQAPEASDTVHGRAPYSADGTAQPARLIMRLLAEVLVDQPDDEGQILPFVVCR